MYQKKVIHSMMIYSCFLSIIASVSLQVGNVEITFILWKLFRLICLPILERIRVRCCDTFLKFIISKMFSPES